MSAITRGEIGMITDLLSPFKYQMGVSVTSDVQCKRLGERATNII